MVFRTTGRGNTRRHLQNAFSDGTVDKRQNIQEWHYPDTSTGGRAGNRKLHLLGGDCGGELYGIEVGLYYGAVEAGEWEGVGEVSNRNM